MSEPTNPNSLLAPSTVYELTSLSRTTVWRLVRAGEFPLPARVSSNRIAWRRKDIEDWLDKWFPENRPDPPAGLYCGAI